MFFLFVTASEYFSLSLYHFRFIPNFLCTYLRSYFRPLLLHSNFDFFIFLEILHPLPCLVSFLSNPFFPSFLATLQAEFFTNIMTGLETSGVNFHGKFGLGIPNHNNAGSKNLEIPRNSKFIANRTWNS